MNWMQFWRIDFDVPLLRNIESCDVSVGAREFGDNVMETCPTAELFGSWSSLYHQTR